MIKCRFPAVFNICSDIIKHETGFLCEVPVQAGGDIFFLPSPDSLIVQIQIGIPQAQLQRTPFPLKGLKVFFRLYPGKDTLRLFITPVFSGKTITDIEIITQEIRVAICIGIRRVVEPLPLKRKGTVRYGYFCADKI